MVAWGGLLYLSRAEGSHGTGEGLPHCGLKRNEEPTV